MRARFSCVSKRARRTSGGSVANAMKKYVRTVETINRIVGRATMYLIFAMMGILLYGAISRSILDMPLL